MRCAGLVRDLENIRKEAAALPDLVPSRDLWEGIEARIAAPVIPLAARPERQRRFAPAWMGIAAAALVVSTAGITYTLTSRSLTSGVETPGCNGNAWPDEDPRSTTSGSEPQSPDAVHCISAGRRRRSESLPGDVGIVDAARRCPGEISSASHRPARRSSEAVYGKEIEMLQRIVSQRKTQLDSSTVAIIEKNLQIIDAAIAQSKAALAKDPASMLLSGQLTHALDKKVELLRTAALLPANT